MDAKDVGDAANGAAANQVAVAIVNQFQAIEVEKQNRKRAAGAVRALGFIFENVKQAAVVGKPRERVADRHVADALEKAGVIEKRSAKRDGIAQNHKDRKASCRESG